MRLEDFGYPFPRDRIALEPVTPRDRSRLMILERETGKREHRHFHELPEFLRPGDLLVVNDTKVLPARLVGFRATGGRVKALLLGPRETGGWHVLLDTSRRLRMDETLTFDERLRGTIAGKEEDGRWILHFDGSVEEAMERIGRAPLPPYIRREEVPEDRQRYQTVYARSPGAIAAPTAGLHFTPSLLERVRDMGVEVRPVTLHAGLGTFGPVRSEQVEDHRVAPERYEIPRETLQALPNRRVVAVGTTTVRALETWARTGRRDGESDLFIHPPYEFRVVKALITNFHLPQSTLLMLVCAFAGRERVLAAYEEALKTGYRFYSYGDAMLIR